MACMRSIALCDVAVGTVDKLWILRLSRQTMMHCETCSYRKDRECKCPRIREAAGDRHFFDRDDELIYPYDEGGTFYVGPKFGCVHHTQDEVKDLRK